MKDPRSYSLVQLACLVFFLPLVWASNYSAFTDDVELRAALESFMANDTTQIMAKYGPIDVWNVSLVTDMKGMPGYVVVW